MAPAPKTTSDSDGAQTAAAPSISLPKGGGAIRGIGEKFAANPVTGTGSMSVPIATSPGRSGFGPQLSLSYDSGAGNGPFGLGWSLSTPSITRKTDKGLPQYFDGAESDVFILSGAEDLAPEFKKAVLSRFY
jgi:Salmonella virulence plasmid 65kDa B protein